MKDFFIKGLKTITTNYYNFINLHTFVEVN